MSVHKINSDPSSWKKGDKVSVDDRDFTVGFPFDVPEGEDPFIYLYYESFREVKIGEHTYQEVDYVRTSIPDINGTFPAVWTPQDLKLAIQQGKYKVDKNSMEAYF